jgi:hypothetical protein
MSYSSSNENALVLPTLRSPDAVVATLRAGPWLPIVAL